MNKRTLLLTSVFFFLLANVVQAQEMTVEQPSSAATMKMLEDQEGVVGGLLLGTDIRTTTSTSPQNETSIAGDPTNALIVIGGMNDYSLLGTGFGGNGVVYSSDGGATWTHHSTGIPLPTGFTNAGGDPSIAFNSSGRAHYTHIASAAGASIFTRNNGIFASSSTDGGVTWSSTVGVATNMWPGSGTVPFEDKEMVASDEYAGSPFTDYVYVSWTRFYDGVHPADGLAGGGDILFSRSMDNGATWSVPIIVSSPANEPGNGGTGAAGSSYVQGSEPEVEADGDVYVVYWFKARINVSRSADGGVTFGPATQPFGTGSGVSFVPSPQPSETFRVNAFPNIETDPTRPGYVYVVAADADGFGGVGRDGGDIIFARSTDNGATWGSTIILNDDASGNNQIFPWMAVSNLGTIGVIWYDTRLDAVGPIKDLDVYFTNSTDGGVTWSPNVRLTDASFDPNIGSPFSGQAFFGDYNGLGVSPNGPTFHALWTDNRDGATGRQEIYYDFSPDPLPVELLNFTATVVQRNDVRLDWTTLTEINNYGFEVQKATTEPVDYQTIPNSFIPGHGTTNVPQYYSYTDASVRPGIWYYRLKQIDLDGTVHYSDGISVDILTGVSEKPLPIAYSLGQNYPNPFNPTTLIQYTLPTAGHVSLAIYDVLGRKVATLVNARQESGYYETEWDATGVSSGVYFYRIQAGDFVAMKKLVFMK